MALITEKEILTRLAQARMAAGLSQRQVDKMLGASSFETQTMEAGQYTLTMGRFLKLCELYDCNPTWALTGLNPDFDPAPIIERARRVKMDADDLLALLDTFTMMARGE